MKIKIVDTNVILSDVNALSNLAGKNVKLIVLHSVVVELERFKTKMNQNGYNARRALSLLDNPEACSKLNLSVLSDGVDKHYVTRSECYADRDILDYFCNHEDREASTLVSNDLSLRVLVRNSGGKAEYYLPDNLKERELYEKYRTIEVKHFDDFDDLVEGEPVVLEGTGMYVNEIATAYNKSEGKVYQINVRLHSDGYLRIVKDKYSQGEVYGIRARNTEQEFLQEVLMDPNIKCVAAIGKAGTGKTLLALAAGLEMVVNRGYGSKNRDYNKVIVMRPAVGMGKELGFLPGSQREKLDAWMGPVYDSIDVLAPNVRENKSQPNRKHTDDLEDLGLLEFQALCNIRGRSIPKAFIIIDEAQNLTKEEVKTIVTRAGKGTKLVFTGDPHQIDTKGLDLHNNGLTYLVKKLRGEDLFSSVVLTKGERSELAELGASKL